MTFYETMVFLPLIVNFGKFDVLEISKRALNLNGDGLEYVNKVSYEEINKHNRTDNENGK